MEPKEISKNMSQDEMAFERTEMSSERTAMAGERTAMALERTSLANSQTFLAYIRTAIGVLAAGIGMFEFVHNQAIITLGLIIMFISPVIVGIGIIHYVLVRKKIRDFRS